MFELQSICNNVKCNHNENNYNPKAKKFYKHKHSHNKNPHTGLKKVNLFGRTLNIDKKTTSEMNDMEFYNFCLYNLYRQSVGHNNNIVQLKIDLEEQEKILKQMRKTKNDFSLIMNNIKDVNQYINKFINKLTIKLKKLFFVLLGVFIAYFLFIFY